MIFIVLSASAASCFSIIRIFVIIIHLMLRLIARFYFWVTGWKIDKKPPPDLKKCVLLAAPHTSKF